MIKGKRNDDENIHTHTQPHQIGKSITVKTSLAFKCYLTKKQPLKILHRHYTTKLYTHITFTARNLS